MKRVIGVILLMVLLISAFPAKVGATAKTVPGFPDLYPFEEVSGYLMADKMPVVVFPLDSDFFYSYFSDYKKTIPANVRNYELSKVELGYKNLFMVPDPDNSSGYVRYTVLYHTTGTRLLALGIFDRGYLDKSNVYVPVVKYYSSDVRTSQISPDTEHSILGDFYPNKIINDLEAAQAILDYQTENGPFRAGVTYSMLDILNIHGRRGYLPGLTSDLSLAQGGGVCVIATNWFKMLVLSGSKIVDHWQHPTLLKYFENPIGSAELTMAATDATVQGPDFDLTWVQKNTGWVTVSTAVMPGGNVVADKFGDFGNSSDALEVITFRFTSVKPDLSTAKIEALQSAYANYRLGQAGAVALADGNKLVKKTPWGRGDSTSVFLSKIVPEERVSRFADDLTSDPFLKSMVSLRSTLNLISPTSNTRVGSYLSDSDWYLQETALLGHDPQAIKQLTAGLSHLDQNSNDYPGQKVQCYGLGVLIASIDSQFVQIGGIPILHAADLVPTDIRNGSKIVVASPTGGAIRVVTSIDDLAVGDIAIRYDTTTGHVLMVIGKKTVNGQTVLLLMSANQRGDGQVAIFEVDKSNFDAVLGVPAYLKVVIRKY